MFLMSASIVVCENVLFSNRRASQKLFSLNRSSKLLVSLTRRRRQLCGIIASAKNGHSRKRKWWQKFLLDDDGNWFGLKEEDMLEDPESSSEKELSEVEKFEAWKRRAEAISELREAQEDMRNAENRKWEDWLVEGPGDVNSSSWDQNWGNGVGESREDLEDNTDVLKPEKGLVESVRDLVLGKEDDELLYEDRVFRYVKTVPLAAEMLDVRKHQKLEMVKALKFERARYRFEVEIGKSPPLSDEEVWMELRHKALEMRDEWRLENRRAFANIWSDMVFGVSLFILLYFNQSKVALLKFTGYKIINNVSDTGKAFLIILITDIFLGYHSESGWQTLLEVIIEHYGFEVDQSAITIFVCIIPVIVDACVKLWLFKFLPRLSPRVSNIFREMTRH